MARIEKDSVRWAKVDRPGDVGMDLPPGATARDLSPTDYHPVDMEPIAAKDVRSAGDAPGSARP